MRLDYGAVNAGTQLTTREAIPRCETRRIVQPDGSEKKERERMQVGWKAWIGESRRNDRSQYTSCNVS